MWILAGDHSGVSFCAAIQACDVNASMSLSFCQRGAFLIVSARFWACLISVARDKLCLLWQMKVEDGLVQREIHSRMQAQQAEQVRWTPRAAAMLRLDRDDARQCSSHYEA